MQTLSKKAHHTEPRFSRRTSSQPTYTPTIIQIFSSCAKCASRDRKIRGNFTTNIHWRGIALNTVYHYPVRWTFKVDFSFHSTGFYSKIAFAAEGTQTCTSTYLVSMIWAPKPHLNGIGDNKCLLHVRERGKLRFETGGFASVWEGGEGRLLTLRVICTSMPISPTRFAILSVSGGGSSSSPRSTTQVALSRA